MDQTETPAPGEAQIMRPLGAGDPAPMFMLPDPDDVMISSAELLENGPLVVTFYRGIWCPYCCQDLKHLGNAAPDIRSCGASLVAIAHQTVPDKGPAPCRVPLRAAWLSPCRQWRIGWRHLAERLGSGGKSRSDAKPTP